MQPLKTQSNHRSTANWGGCLDFIFTVCGICECVWVCVCTGFKNFWLHRMETFNSRVKCFKWTPQQQYVSFPDNMIQPYSSHSSLFTQLYYSWLYRSNEPRHINNHSPKRETNNNNNKTQPYWSGSVYCVSFCSTLFNHILKGVLCSVKLICSAPFNSILLWSILLQLCTIPSCSALNIVDN